MQFVGILLVILNYLIPSNYAHYYCILTTEYKYACTLKDFVTVSEAQTFLSERSLLYLNDSWKKISMSTINIIEMENMTISSIPMNLFSKFPQMTKLDAKNVGIKGIISEDFQFATDLQELNLSWNKIKKLENVQFLYLQSITEIDISHNLIEAIHNGAFDKIGKTLKYLDVSHNQIKELKEENLISLNWNLNHNSLVIHMGHNAIEKFVPASENAWPLSVIKALYVYIITIN